MARTKKPSAAKVRNAAKEMDLAWAALEQSQLDFALLVYDSDCRDIKSFCEGMRRALSEQYSTSSGTAILEETYHAN